MQYINEICHSINSTNFWQGKNFDKLRYVLGIWTKNNLKYLKYWWEDYFKNPLLSLLNSLYFINICYAHYDNQ